MRNVISSGEIDQSPVFFDLKRRRWLVFASLTSLILLFIAGIVAVTTASLVSDHVEKLVGLSPKAAEHLVVPKQARHSKSSGKAVALVFNGVPAEGRMPEVLDLLSAQHVPATFFLLGKEAASRSQEVEHLFNSGHEIGNRLQAGGGSDVQAKLDARSTTRVIEAVTGHSTLLHLGQVHDSGDAAVPLANVGTIASDGSLVLGSGAASLRSDEVGKVKVAESRIERQDSYVIVVPNARGAAGLPQMIDSLRSRGFRFTTVSGLLGKQRNDVMPELTSAVDLFLARVNRLVLAATRHGGTVLDWLFTGGAFLAMIRTVVIVVMAVLCHRQRKQLHKRLALANTPLAAKPNGLVSVIIPSYNEILNVASVIKSALGSDYPQVEVIFVDDGSTDGSFDHVSALYGQHPQVRLLQKANGGKASALNVGLRFAKGEVVVCIDADTLMTPTTIDRLLSEFTSPDVAAVAGCVRVANPGNLLTRWQEVEYMIGQNLDRQALGLVNGINTVPGALGAFRREAMLEAGGYQSDTLAEDTDLTMRLLASGHKVAFAPHALAMTEAPETAKMLMKQRYRWSFGAMQTLWKHRGSFGNSACPGLGWFTMPQVLIFQLLLPFLVPLADAFLIASLWSNPSWHVLTYGLVFLTVDLAAATLALILAGERLRLPYLTLMLLTQRVGYRYFVFIPLLKALLSAIRGRSVGWGHLQRLGRVAQGATVQQPEFIG